MMQPQQDTVTTTPKALSDPFDLSFHQGAATHAHLTFAPHQEGEHTVFRVWAPHAEYVALTGDFTDWNNGTYPMQRLTEGGIWETRVPVSRLCEGQAYKYFIRNGCRELYKADPFGCLMEKPPKTASLLYSIQGYPWRDAPWLNWRKKHFTREKAAHRPIHIYELHAGSWRRHADGTPYTYPQLAAELVTYVKQMGYTHICLMPLTEHSDDASLGYRPCGFYAATSRYGTPKELMAFVDTMHEAGIGVIMDWAPASLSKDAHGLFEFDGQPLYEYQSVDRMECPDGVSRRFDMGRGEVQSFLLSNAVFWIEQFHLDGLRVCAVTTLLYPDGARTGKPSREATDFLCTLNRILSQVAPDVITLADMAFPTDAFAELDAKSLGFTLLQNTGMLHELLAYQREDPLWRKYHHEKLTHPIGEDQLLALSHDAVNREGRALTAQLPCGGAQALANARVLMTYLMTVPAKKLCFMGTELGQKRAWCFDGETEWELLEDPAHAAQQLFFATLNHFYLEHPALWELDGAPDGFAWIDAKNRDLSIYSYRRRDTTGRELIILLNFTPVERRDFLLMVPNSGIWEEILSTADVAFGGEGSGNPAPTPAEKISSAGERAIRIRIPPMSASVFRRVDRHG